MQFHCINLFSKLLHRLTDIYLTKILQNHIYTNKNYTIKVANMITGMVRAMHLFFIIFFNIIRHHM